MLALNASVTAVGLKPVVVKVPVANVVQLIEMTCRNWAVVSQYFSLLGPEQSGEFLARWESAMKVAELPARNRFLFDVLKTATDCLAIRLRCFVTEAFAQAEKDFPVVLDPEFLAKMNNVTLPSWVRVYAADMLVLGLISAQLDAAEQKVRTLPPQICRTKFNHLDWELRLGAEKDPLGTLKRIQGEVLPLLETLRSSSYSCCARLSTKRKTARHH